MIKDIRKILEQKVPKRVDEDAVAWVCNTAGYPITRSNVTIHNGIISFINIPSSLRLTILLHKQTLLEEIRKKGVYVRDIL